MARGEAPTLNDPPEQEGEGCTQGEAERHEEGHDGSGRLCLMCIHKPENGEEKGDVILIFQRTVSSLSCSLCAPLKQYHNLQMYPVEFGKGSTSGCEDQVCPNFWLFSVETHFG